MYQHSGPHFLKASEIAFLAGTTKHQVEKWVKQGRLPSKVTINGERIHDCHVIPADEVHYILALMRAGKSWCHIEHEVQRTIRNRDRLIVSRTPDHLEGES